MTYDKIFQYRTCPTGQHRNRLAQETRGSDRGGIGTGNPIRNIEAAGVSLREGGRCCRQADSSARPEDRLYRQNFRKSNTSITSICSSQGANAKRSRHKGLRSLSLQRSEAWLSRGKRIDQLSWNTVLTGCQHGKSAKHTSFSSLAKYGVRAMAKTV